VSIAEETPDPATYWEARARAAEEAVRALSRCFAILCDREENNTVVLTDKELMEIGPKPFIWTTHNKVKGEMRITYVKE
jgi:hypothetical protein